MKKESISNLNILLGRYRLELMGFAILWIIFFHMNFVTWNKIAYYIHTIGFFGVDMFFFLSAYGLYYSLSKKSVFMFYKARIIKIYPLYLFVATIFFFINGLSGMGNYILYVTGIGYWVGANYFEWYVPTLIVFYALTPFLYKIFSKIKDSSKIYFIIFSILISIILSVFSVQMGWNYVIGSLTRIPVFVLGFYIGDLAYHKKKMHINSMATILCVFVVGILLSYFSTMYFKNSIYLLGFDCYPALLLAPSLCYLLAYIFSKLDEFNHKVYKFLTFPLMSCGIISFELYLVQQRVSDLYLSAFLHNGELIIFFLTIIFALFLHYLIYFIEKIMLKKWFLL